MIYTHVHHEVTITQWPYPIPYSRSILRGLARECYCQAADLAFTNVPWLGLLLTNSQLCFEYQDTPCFKSLRVTIHLHRQIWSTSSICEKEAKEE